jgi:hypothetical protein
VPAQPPTVAVAVATVVTPAPPPVMVTVGAASQPLPPEPLVIPVMWPPVI